MSDLENYLTVKEAAKKMGVSERTVRDLCKGKKLPGSIQTAKGQPWQIPIEAIQKWIGDPILPSKPFYEQRWFLGLTAVLVLVAAIFAILADSGVRDWVYQQFRGRSFASATEDEALIIVATFYHTEGVADVATHDEIRRAIQKHIDELNLENVRVAIEPTVIQSANRDQAESLGNHYNATLIIWGSDTGVRLEINFLNLKEPYSYAANTTISETAKTQMANPEAYSQFIVDELPRQLTYLSLFALGQSESSKGNYEQAIEFIEAAVPSLLMSNESSFDELELDSAYFRLGWLYETVGNYEEAKNNYDLALNLDSSSADAYNNRGIVNYYLGEFSEALNDYNQAMILAPSLAEPYLGRGIVYSESGEFDKAISDYSRAIELNPAMDSAFTNRGFEYLGQGKLTQALSDFSAAIQINPQSFTAHNGLGLTLSHQEKHEEAISSFYHAILLNLYSVEVYNNRGTSYSSIGQFESAVADYNHGLSIQPDYWPLYFNRGVDLYQMARLEEARIDLITFLQTNPELQTRNYAEDIIREIDSTIQE